MKALIVATFLVTLVAMAQAPVVSSPQAAWPLQRVIQEAMDKNPYRKQVAEGVNVANAAVWNARSDLFPELNATASAKTQKDASNSMAPTFGGSTYNSYTFEVTAKQPLFRWGVFSGVSAPKREREIAELNSEITDRNLMADVIRAFYALLLTQRYVENLQNIEFIEKESLATAQQRQRTGRGQLLDVLQVKTQLALLAPKLAKARNDASLSSAALANLMGNPSIKEIRVTGKLDISGFKDVGSRLDFKNYNLPEYKSILAQKEKVEATKASVLGGNYPRLDLVGSWGRRTTQKVDLFDSYSTAWSYGLQLSIPLFSGLSSIGERRSYAAQVAQANYAQQKLENDLSYNQIKSLQNLKLAQESIASSVLAFDLANDSLNEAKRNFRYATIDFLQYLSVQEDYLEAASSLDQAKYTYIDSLLNYFINSGQSLKQLAELLEGATK